MTEKWELTWDKHFLLQKKCFIHWCSRNTVEVKGKGILFNVGGQTGKEYLLTLTNGMKSHWSSQWYYVDLQVELPTSCSKGAALITAVSPFSSYWQRGHSSHEIATHPNHLFLELEGKLKWLPLKFGYHHAIRTCPNDIHLEHHKSKKHN